MLVPVVLLLVGVLAILIEFFVPAFGLVGVLGAGSIITGIVIAFRTLGNLTGSIFLIISLILVPVMTVLFFKTFPGSFMGKRLILSHSQHSDDGWESHERDRYSELPGRNGICITDLRPSGMVMIEGNKYSVVSTGDYIEKDSEIDVIGMEGSRIIVERRK